MTRLHSESRVCSRKLVVVVLDNDVTMAAVHRAVVRTLDDDDVGTMMPAPMMAIAVVVKRLGAMTAMMEASSVLIYDDSVRTMVMAVLVRGENDRIGRRNRRRGQAKRQRAQNQGGFHFQLSKEVRCPSVNKHPLQTLVPAWSVSPLDQANSRAASLMVSANERQISQPNSLAGFNLKKICGRIPGHRVLERVDGRAVGDIDQHGRRGLNLVGRFFDLVESHQHSIMEHRQPGRVVEHAALVIVRVQRFEQHHGPDSSTRSWQCDLQQSISKPSFAALVPFAASEDA